MDQIKSWHTSKGVWANIITVIVSMAMAFQLVDEDAGKIIVEKAPEFIVTVITTLSGLFGLYGRVVAKKAIGPVTEAPIPSSSPLADIEVIG